MGNLDAKRDWGIDYVRHVANAAAREPDDYVIATEKPIPWSSLRLLLVMSISTGKIM